MLFAELRSATLALLESELVRSEDDPYHGRQLRLADRRQVCVGSVVELEIELRFDALQPQEVEVRRVTQLLQPLDRLLDEAQDFPVFAQVLQPITPTECAPSGDHLQRLEIALPSHVHRAREAVDRKSTRLNSSH